MSIAEVYQKYKHLDALLSDETACRELFEKSIIYDLWQAVKQEVEKEIVK